MDIKQLAMRLYADKDFLEWKSADSYLAHVFTMIEEEKESVCQFGFYLPAEDKLVPVEVSDQSIAIGVESEIFKKEGRPREISLDKATVSAKEALDLARQIQKEKYRAEQPLKIILILQYLGDRMLYNITFVTHGFKTLNIKLDAATGAVLHESLDTIFSFQKGEK